jgi:transposase
MIVPSLGVKVLIAMKPVDFRKGMDGLAAVVRETLGANPFGGVIYVFRSKRAADRVKLLFWDGTGLVLATKRLEQGSFRWPSLREGVMRLTPAQLAALLEGLDWARVRGVRTPTPTAVS